MTNMHTNVPASPKSVPEAGVEHPTERPVPETPTPEKSTPERPVPQEPTTPQPTPEFPQPMQPEPEIPASQPEMTATSHAALFHPPQNSGAMGPTSDAASAKGGTPLWVTGALALLLAGGVAWVWQDRPAADGSTARIAALEDALKTAQQRVSILEQRPTGGDATRMATLEASLRALAARPVQDTTNLEARLGSLEQRPVPVIPDVAKDFQAAMAGASAELNARLASLDIKLQQEMAQATRLRTATTALEAGKPLGDLPGASPALSRFAQMAPPTEPALRQSFASFATKAEAASRPSAAGHDFAERMWMRAQQLVTVRQGDKVLVGAPAAVTLAAAHTKLDAGDLAGAVTTLASLDDAARAAMAPWVGDAQALLDARAALSSMAAKS